MRTFGYLSAAAPILALSVLTLLGMLKQAAMGPELGVDPAAYQVVMAFGFVAAALGLILGAACLVAACGREG